MKLKIHELRTTYDDGSARFIYFARIKGEWVDLAPFGNRLP